MSQSTPAYAAPDLSISLNLTSYAPSGETSYVEAEVRHKSKPLNIRMSLQVDGSGTDRDTQVVDKADSDFRRVMTEAAHDGFILGRIDDVGPGLVNAVGEWSDSAVVNAQIDALELPHLDNATEAQRAEAVLDTLKHLFGEIARASRA